jgi:hypothetical protein
VTAKPASGPANSKVHSGLNAGLGLQVAVGAAHAFVEGRYENLFTDKGLDASASRSKKSAARIVPIAFGVVD